MSLSEVELNRLVYKAKLAEQAERFDEMANFMQQVIKSKKALDAEEQKLFSIAYKNYIGRSRTAWKLANAARAKYVGKNSQKESYAALYAEELSGEILRICREVETNLALLAGSASDTSTKAAYAKMDADYRRYRCEIEAKETSNASDAYRHASNVAQTLNPNHPTRMGIALNHSVFTYEVENNLEEACRIAEEALDRARSVGGGEGSRDGYLIEHLLKDNIDLWRSELPKSKEDLVY